MLNHFGENIMKRLSLEELKAKAGMTVITQLESVKGGEDEDLARCHTTKPKDWDAGGPFGPR
jgi:hypothetical protein